MANLLGQDIGLNYKGIITIGSTINQNVSASLQSLTDGDGNALPLQLATGLVGVVGGTIAYTTGTNTRDVLSQTYTINATGGTNTITGLKINATETAVVGTTHNLLDLQVGSISRLKCANSGLFTIDSIATEAFYLASNGYGAVGKIINRNSSGFSGIEYLKNTGAVGTFTGFSNSSNEFRFNNILGDINFYSNGNLLASFIASNRSVAIGHTAASSRLHVRGDGTNPIFRAENTDGTYRYLMNLTQQIVNVGNGGFFNVRPNEGTTNNPGIDFAVGTSGNLTFIRFAGERYTIGHTGANNANAGILFQINNSISTANFSRFTFGVLSTSITVTSGTSAGLIYTDTFAAAAGSANYRPLSINYTINNSGAQSGTVTGIYLNSTQTNLNGATHNLMDLQVGGISKFLISNTGAIGNSSSSIGLFGVTPIAQPTTAISQAAVTPGGGGSILEDDLFGGYTVAQVVQALINLGILKP